MRISAIEIPPDVEQQLGMQPKPPKKPSFGMKYNQRVIKTSLHSHKTVDEITLSNGKRVTIQTQYLCGDKFTKLSSLRDKFGNWVKSILRYYSKNKPFKELRSHNQKAL